MRSRADAERVESFMRLLGERARIDGNVHLTGGASADPAIDPATFKAKVDSTFRDFGAPPAL